MEINAIENEYIVREQQILTFVVNTRSDSQNLDLLLDNLTQIQTRFGRQLFHQRAGSICLLKIVSPDETAIPNQYFWVHEGFLTLASGLFREIFRKLRIRGVEIEGNLSTNMASVHWYPRLDVPVSGTNETAKIPTLALQNVPHPQSIAELLFFIYSGDVRRLLNYTRRNNGLGILNNLQFLEVDARLVDLVVAKIEELKTADKKVK
jgi:hypothetical protein